MKVSEGLIKKLMEFEGLRLEAYEDAAGVPTIGYGHTAGVRMGDHISEYWAKELLLADVAVAEREVEALEMELTQGQWDALVSFVFNLGIGRLKSSTLLKVIRSGGSMRQIRREFMRWVHAGGVVMKGLEKRRAWEVERFFASDEEIFRFKQ